MKRFLHTSLLLSLLFPTCFAEETAPWEVFGGYSFQRADVRQYFISRPTPLIYAARHHYVNMNGWELSDGEPESVVWRDAGYHRLLRVAGGRERYDSRPYLLDFVRAEIHVSKR